MSNLKPGAVALITNKTRSKVLIQQKDHTHPIVDYRHKFSLFGGSIEPGESPEEGLLRELSEELPGIEQFNINPVFWRNFELQGYRQKYDLFVYLIMMTDQAFDALEKLIDDENIVQEGVGIVIDRLQLLPIAKQTNSFIASLEEVIFEYLKE